ncbi:MAG TPA: choice-of-anchor Q domain-containing protein [Terriglobales bacterium]|nr:choice-of-anchor Q domain-containing protein [Terriglobales bacterium]
MTSRAICRLVEVAASILLLTASSLATNYYVSTSGNNSNNGLTPSTAWRNIQYAADHVQAGDTVNILGGVYNELVNIAVSGSVDAGYITFQNYSGQAAIIDGAHLSVPGGQYGLINIASQSYIVIQGLEIRNYKTKSTKEVPIGIYVTGAGSNLQFFNNHIHDIQTLAKGCAADAFGVAFYGNQAPASLNNITFSGNELDHMKTGCSETLTFNGNVDTFTVTSNIVHDNNNIGIDGIGFEGTSPDPAYDQARNGYIGENTVYNITSQKNPAYPKGCWCADGIYVDGGTNIVVERNLVHNVDLGIEMASEHQNKTTSYVIARSNVVYFGNSAGISIGGYANRVGGSDNITIVNNTLYENDSKRTGSGEFQIQYHATNNIFMNNIVYSGKQGLLVNNFTNSEPDPASLDYNLYYSAGTAKKTTFVWEHKSYAGFSAYAAATGNDAHSSYGDPLFLNGTTPDLRVQSSSPAVGSGINLGASVVGTLDFSGNPRVQGASIDIGAYEQ